MDPLWFSKNLDEFSWHIQVFILKLHYLLIFNLFMRYYCVLFLFYSAEIIYKNRKTEFKKIWTFQSISAKFNTKGP